MSQTIELIPFDTLFFRDGKPFSLGEESFADGVFPPFPSVIYGAIRSAYFAENIEHLSLANTEADPTRNLQIKSIYYARGKEFFVPIPLDILHNNNSDPKNGVREVVFTKALQAVNGAFSNCPLQEQLSTSSSEVEEIDGGLLPSLLFRKYLSGILQEQECTYRKISDFVVTEDKVGIGRNKLLGTSSDGMLYRVAMQRLGNNDNFLSINVTFSGLSILPKMLKLGGEGKAVFCNVVEEARFDEPVDCSDDIRLYLLTPAIFKYGWQASWMKKGVFHVNGREIHVTLTAAAVGKPISIGGFAIKSCHNGGAFPKPMHKAVPSGSVYFLKIENAEERAIFISSVHGKSISEYDTSKEGFGIALIGQLITH